MISQIRVTRAKGSKGDDLPGCEKWRSTVELGPHVFTILIVVFWLIFNIEAKILTTVSLKFDIHLIFHY